MSKSGGKKHKIAYFGSYWAFGGQWSVNYGQKIYYDSLFKVRNGLYNQNMSFGHLEIIFNVPNSLNYQTWTICLFVFTSFLAHFTALFWLLRPTDSNYVQKNIV